MVNNSELCWKEETTEGTSIITAVDTQAYKFGKLIEGQDEVTVLSLENEIKEYHNYASRVPNLEWGNIQIPNFKFKFEPVNAIPYYHFLGSATDAAVSTIDVLESSTKPTLTIHHQEDETVNHIRQLLGAKCVAIAGKIEINKPEELEVIYAGKQIVDGGDSAPMLTTTPIFPESVENGYFGKPKVTWDDGGAGEKTMNEVWQVQYSQNQNISIVHAGDDEKDVHCHQFNPVSLRLVGIMASEDEWDALKDQITIGQITVRSCKNKDYTADYKDLEFLNCKVEKINKLGKVGLNMYMSTLEIKAEELNLSFIDGFGANFSNFYG